MLAAEPGCCAPAVETCGACQRLRVRYHTELLNPSGLIALWSYWKKSEFWLLPKDFDIHNPRNLLVIGTDFGIDPRLEAKLAHDIHTVRSHTDAEWVTVQRLNPSSLFPTEEKSRLYADRMAARHQRLVGYVEAEPLPWWVVAPDLKATSARQDILFRLWECVLRSTSRLSDYVAKELSLNSRAYRLKSSFQIFCAGSCSNGDPTIAQLRHRALKFIARGLLSHSL